MQNLSDMQLLVEVWNYLERKKQVCQFYQLIPNTSSSGPFCSGCCSAVFEVRQRSRDDDDDDEEGEDEEQLELLQGLDLEVDHYLQSVRRMRMKMVQMTVMLSAHWKEMLTRQNEQ